jgi:serine O-acetyltransferase
VIDGIRIGEEVTVGAGSVVISDIGPKATAVGVPARVVGDRIT